MAKKEKKQKPPKPTKKEKEAEKKTRKENKEKKRAIYQADQDTSLKGKLQGAWRTLNINRQEKSYFVENLAMLLAAGMDIYSAMDAIELELKSKGMKELLNNAKMQVDEGIPLWAALENTGLLPAHVVSLIRIGEQSGNLSKNLAVIVMQQDKERQFKSQLRSAMTYPVFVFGLTGVIGIGIAWFVLPRLSEVFASMRIDLPWITKLVIQFGLFVGEYGTYVVPGSILALALILYLLFMHPKGKQVGQSMLFVVPGIKQLILNIEIARMGYILGTLLGAGLPIVDAVDSMRDIASFYRYRKLYIYMKEQIEVGKTFADVFDSFKRMDKLYPVSIQQMITTAEQSGHLPETLMRIGETFETKTENSTKNLTVILEPVLLVVVWLGVVGIAMAVILPIYSLLGGLDQTPDEFETPEPTVAEEESVDAVDTPEEFPEAIDFVPASETEDGQDDIEAEEQTAEETGAEEPAGQDENGAEAPEEPVEEPVEEEEPSAEEPAAEEPAAEEAPETAALQQVRILDTGTGYLNVRSEPDSSLTNVITTVAPGEILTYTVEQNGWYQITLPDGQTGWIAGQYAEVL